MKAQKAEPTWKEIQSWVCVSCSRPAVDILHELEEKGEPPIGIRFSLPGPMTPERVDKNARLLALIRLQYHRRGCDPSPEVEEEWNQLLGRLNTRLNHPKP